MEDLNTKDIANKFFKGTDINKNARLEQKPFKRYGLDWFGVWR